MIRPGNKKGFIRINYLFAYFIKFIKEFIIKIIIYVSIILT